MRTKPCQNQGFFYLLIETIAIMRKQTIENQTNELLKVNKIKPVKQLSRQELINQKAELVKTGKITAFDLGKELKLTDKQTLFAEAYCSTEMFGDKVAAAGKAYSIDVTDKNQRHYAVDKATELTKHVGVNTLINILLNVGGLNHTDVDAQLHFLIMQHGDLKVKALGVKMYNELNNRIKTSSEITVKHQYDYSNLSDDEIDQLIRLKEKAQLQDGYSNPLPIDDVEGEVID